MRRGAATAAVLAGLMLGASGVLAQQQDPTTAKTTNTYDADSTSEDIRLSCKDLTAKATAVGAVTVVGECNKANSDGAVSAVSTIINISNHAGCHKTRGRGYRVDWGTGSSSATMFDGFILLTSTGKSYVFGAYCRDATLTKDGPSGMDIGETTNGLKNDAGSLAKR